MPADMIKSGDDTEVGPARVDQSVDARAVLKGVEHEPGASKPDPLVVADGIVRRFGGLTAVDVEHVEIQRGVITALIGPNGAGKTTFFNLLTGFDKPDEGSWSFSGKGLRGCPGVQGGAAGHGADVPAHQGALQADGDGEHADRRHRPVRREHAPGDVPTAVASPGEPQHRARDGTAPPLQARREEGRLRRLPLRRAAQAARDGPRTHGRARAGDAGRADGWGQPGAEAVVAGPREVAARGRHDRALRGARHGHGARHLRLGDRDGPGQDHRRGAP